MITGPVPVSPHDTPKPRRSRQSARALRKSASARLVASLASDGNLVTHERLDRLAQDRSLHIVRQILVHTGVLPQRKE